MANRFNDQYRPPHGGDSVFPNTQRRLTPELRLQSWGGTDEKGEFNQKGADKTYTFKKSPPSPPNTKGGNYSKSTENPYMDEGGLSVPRKPKSPKKPSSGGMALPLPQKVK